MAKRPLREGVENRLEGFEGGPLGVTGRGRVAGATGYFAVETVRTIFNFIPGVRKPGYSISSHNTEFIGGRERHTFKITAASKDVAEFVARYYSVSSNIALVKEDTEIVSTEVKTSRPTFSTFEVVVDVR